MTGVRELAVWLTIHWELLAVAAVYLFAGAFLLAWIALWTKESWRRYRILRAHREAQRQLRAMTQARTNALRHNVVSEKKEAA